MSKFKDFNHFFSEVQKLFELEIMNHYTEALTFPFGKQNTGCIVYKEDCFKDKWRIKFRCEVISTAENLDELYEKIELLSKIK